MRLLRRSQSKLGESKLQKLPCFLRFVWVCALRFPCPLVHMSPTPQARPWRLSAYHSMINMVVSLPAALLQVTDREHPAYRPRFFAKGRSVAEVCSLDRWVGCLSVVQCGVSHIQHLAFTFHLYDLLCTYVTCTASSVPASGSMLCGLIHSSSVLWTPVTCSRP